MKEGKKERKKERTKERKKVEERTYFSSCGGDESYGEMPEKMQKNR